MHLAVQLSSLSFPGYKALKGERIVGLDPVADLRPCSDQNTLDEVGRQIFQRGLLREIPTGRKGRLHLVILYTVGFHQVTQRLECVGVILGLGILPGCRGRCRGRGRCRSRVRLRGWRRCRLRGRIRTRRSRSGGGSRGGGLHRGRRYRGGGGRPRADVLGQGREVQG